MSWDVFIFKFDGTPEEFKKLPANHVAPSLGDAAQVRDLISLVFPETDWSNPSSGDVVEAGYSIEFSVQESGPVRHLALHVRGGGDPVGKIAALCHRNGWAAYDTTAAALLDLEKPSRAGWHSWQSYCSGVVRPPNQADGDG